MRTPTLISRWPVAPTPNGASPPVAASPGSDARRSAPMALVGTACVLIGAAVFFLIGQGDSRRQVLAVARPVAAGETLRSEDLRSVKASSEAGVDLVAFADQASVVGRPAATALVPGSLLSPAQLGAASPLRAGQAVVGVPLKAGQAPTGLSPGTRVAVVDTGAPIGGQPARVLVLTTTAVVSGVERPEAGGTIVASLTLPATDATAVAAAAGRVSLVVLAPTQ